MKRRAFFGAIAGGAAALALRDQDTGVHGIRWEGQPDRRVRFLCNDTGIGFYGGIIDTREVSVIDYGAIGDGVADDTAAIQVALDAANASGVPLSWPPGRYRITSPLHEALGVAVADSVPLGPGLYEVTVRSG